MAPFLWWEEGVLYSQSNSKGGKAPLESFQQHLGKSHSTSKATRVSPSLISKERTPVKGYNPKRKQKQNKSNLSLQTGLCSDRAHGSLRPLAASLCCVNSSGVPSLFHCRQSGMSILLWPWSPPMLKYDQFSHFHNLHAEGLHCQTALTTFILGVSLSSLLLEW